MRQARVEATAPNPRTAGEMQEPAQQVRVARKVVVVDVDPQLQHIGHTQAHGQHVPEEDQVSRSLGMVDRPHLLLLVSAAELGIRNWRLRHIEAADQLRQKLMRRAEGAAGA